jgi:hypothetical protein
VQVENHASRSETGQLPRQLALTQRERTCADVVVCCDASVNTAIVQACVKLADFGLSQSRDSMESFKGEFVEGTLLYMAPGA